MKIFIGVAFLISSGWSLLSLYELLVSENDEQSYPHIFIGGIMIVISLVLGALFFDVIEKNESNKILIAFTCFMALFLSWGKGLRNIVFSSSFLFIAVVLGVSWVTF